MVVKLRKQTTAHKRVKIADLKARLSSHLRDVRAGESIVVVDRETPVAMLTGVGKGITEILDVSPPLAGAGKLASLRSPLKRRLGSSLHSSVDILSELRGDR